MAVIDEEGRLFGRVNVIDALVALLALAMIVAGVALIAGGGGDMTAAPEDDRETRNATVGLGAVPADGAGLVTPGNATLEGENVTVRDVYAAPHPNDTTTVLAKVSVTGEPTDRGFVVGDRVLRYGTALTLETAEYTLSATVRSVGGPAAFDTERVRVTVEANVSDAVAEAIAEGDAQTVAGQETARVVGVEEASSNGERTTVRVELAATVRPLADAYYYGDAPVRIGTRFRFATNRYEFEGAVANVTA